MKPSAKIAEAKKRVRKDDYPTTGFGPWRRFQDQVSSGSSTKNLREVMDAGTAQASLVQIM